MMRKISKAASFLCAATMLAGSMPIMGTMPSVQAKNGEFQQITNDTFFKDKDGNFIYSQGGGIFEFDGKYYWYGVKYAEAVTYPETKVLSSENHFVGITCYSSTDLVNWTDEGIIATPEDVYNETIMEGQQAAWVGRLGVTKLSDGTYALLVQHECDDADNSIDNANRGNTKAETDGWSKQVLIMTSDKPNGHFTWNNRVNMKSYIGTTNTGDQTVFVDPATGQGYLLYSYGSGRGKMYLSKVVKGSDGIVTLDESRMIYSGAGREGNCMFEYGGKYYVCASDLYGWNASHGYYLVLDSLDDEYLKSRSVTTNMELMDGASDDYCHVSQTGFFYTVRGSKQDTVIFCGDRWSDFADNGDGYNVWCPLSFDENGKPFFNSVSSWKLNAQTGEWKVASDNNYVKNGSFDADRITVTDFVGWNEEILDGNGNITNNKDCVTGKYALIMSGQGAYEEQISQTLLSTKDVALADGIYDFSAKIKNTEGFSDLSLYATSGGVTYGQKVLTANEAYTEVTLKNVVVENGQVTIGIHAKGDGATVYADDLTFKKSDVKDYATGTLTGKITGDSATTGKTVKVKATDAEGRYFEKSVALTEGESEYKLEHIPAGTYSIEASGDGVAIKMDATAKDNTVAPIKAISTTGTVKGRVVTKQGKALAGVKVELSGEGKEFEATTDENGEYSFDNVNQGSYSIKYSLSGYSLASGGEDETKVAAGFTTVKSDAMMGKELGKVAGTVRNASGDTVSDALVIARPNEADYGDRYTTRTDSDGHFEFESLPGGEYVIVATATPDKQYDSLPTTAGKVTVSSSKSMDISLRFGDDKTSTINNPTFDGKSVSGWTNGGDAGGCRTGKNQSHGTYDLAPWANSDFKVDTYQKLEGLDNGYYVLTGFGHSDYAEGDSLCLYATNGDGDTYTDTIARGNGPYELYAVKAKVTDGTLTIGIKGNMSSGKWANIDDFHLGYLGDDISIVAETVEQESEEMDPDYTPAVAVSPESIEDMTLVGTSTAVVKKTSKEDNNKSDGNTSSGSKPSGQTSGGSSQSSSSNSGSSNSSASSKPASSGNTIASGNTAGGDKATTANSGGAGALSAGSNASANNTQARRNNTVRSNQQVAATNDVSEDNTDVTVEDSTDTTVDDSTLSTNNDTTEIAEDTVPAAGEDTTLADDNKSNIGFILAIVGVVALAGAGLAALKFKIFS